MSRIPLPTLLRVLAFLLLGLAVTGCAVGGGWSASLGVLLSAVFLFLGGCAARHEVPTDAEVVDSEVIEGTDAGEGTWETCCVDGRVDTCFCEAGWSCNYGWFNDCLDGTCAFERWECFDDAGPPDPPDAGPADAGPADAGAPDASGAWEPCCVAGIIESCWCPAGLECNYGWFTGCGDGTCVEPGLECGAPSPDSGTVVDAGTP